MIRGLELLAPIHPLRIGERLGIKLITSSQLFNQSCLHNGTSIKTLNNGVWWAASWCIHPHAGTEDTALGTLLDLT